LKQESWFSKYSNSDKVPYIAVRNFSHYKDYNTRLKFMQTCIAAHQIPDKGTARKEKLSHNAVRRWRQRDALNVNRGNLHNEIWSRIVWR